MYENREAAARRSVSVLGLGPMGTPIAHNLLSHYGPITVWNRTKSRADPFAERGARVASSPGDAACDLTLTVLPDLPQVESILQGDNGLLVGWKRQQIAFPVLVIHGTVSPVAVADFAHRMWANHQVRVIDAPLSGGTAGAEQATLSVMIGGDEQTAHELIGFFGHIGKTIRYFGPSGSGELAKACNQMVVAATVAALSEALLLARTSNLDLEVVCEVLQGGLARTELLEQKREKFISQDFTQGGSARNQLKDLRFVHDAARLHHVAIPTTQRVTELFERMVAEGDGALDHTGLYRSISRASAQIATA